MGKLFDISKRISCNVVPVQRTKSIAMAAACGTVEDNRSSTSNILFEATNVAFALPAIPRDIEINLAIGLHVSEEERVENARGFLVALYNVEGDTIDG